MAARVDKATLQKMLASGMTIAGSSEPVAKQRKEKPLVELSYISPGEWFLPIKTASESNCTEWRLKSSRTKNARDVVTKILGKHLRDYAEFAEHYHRGGKIFIILRRLGCRHLDTTNLPGSLKATEDAFALVMGASDGGGNWIIKHEEDLDYPAIGVYCKMERL